MNIDNDIFEQISIDFILDRKNKTKEAEDTDRIHEDAWNVSDTWGDKPYDKRIDKKASKNSKRKKNDRAKRKSSKKETIGKKQTDGNEDQGNLVESNNQDIIEIPRQVNSVIKQAREDFSNKYIAQLKELDEAKKHPYSTENRVMTNAEKALYKLLKAELNKQLACLDKSVDIFPKVRVADYININKLVREKFPNLLYKIAYKHVDYLVCDGTTLDIICAIELDDIYHLREDKAARDEFIEWLFREVNIPLFRIRDPIIDVGPASLNYIATYIIEQYKPLCPKCGNLLQVKTSSKKSNYGHRFLGCTCWLPGGGGCNYTLDID